MSKKGPPGDSEDIKKKFLHNVQPRRGQYTQEWLTTITSGVGSGETEVSQAVQTASQPAAVACMDKLFVSFQKCAFDFNSVIGNREFSVNVEGPELAAGSSTSAQKSVRGRLSTRSWTLAIRVHDELIEGFVFPSDQAIHFSGRPEDFKRLFEIEPIWKDGQCCCIVDGLLVSQAQLPLLAKELFAILIGVAKGEKDPSSPFSLVSPAQSSGGQAPSKQPAIPAVQPARQEQLAASGSYPVIPSPVRLAQACEILARSLDSELDALNALGQEAFNKQDDAAVQKLRQRLANLRAMRPQILATLDQWRRAICDE